MTSRILIAEVGAAHGIKGLVKLRLYAQDPDLINTAPLYLAETGNQTARVKIERMTGTSILARINNIADRTTAETWRGTKFYVDRAALPDIDPDTDGYYIEDLIGLAVHDTNGTKIGTIQAVDNFGASDLIEIKPDTGTSFYVPFTDDYVPDVDLEAGFITVQNYTEFLPEISHKTRKEISPPLEGGD